MRVLGTVADVSHEGRLIVKAKFAPALRAKVVDNRRKAVGSVWKVFGPVRAPYVAVHPEPGQRALSLVGREVYIVEVNANGEGARRDRRGRTVPRVQRDPPGT